MISNAKDRKIGDTVGGLPNLAGALKGYLRTMTFGYIKKSIDQVTYDLTEDSVEITTKAMRQPLSARALEQKPEGERSWRWEMLHCLADQVFDEDDVVIFNKVPYRIRMIWDFREYGYMQYHICEDYRK